MKAYPPFLIQIADAQGIIVRTPAGGKHERDLIESIVSSVVAKGVGVFRTQAHVEQSLRNAITEVILDLKVKSPFDVIA